jgi:hypothetical protein
MAWTVRFEDEFEQEFLALSQAVQDELLAAARLLAEYGPRLGRPFVDTLKGSKHANMKELRFDAAGGVWRVAFAFDPGRRGILLVAGDKSGVSSEAFLWSPDRNRRQTLQRAPETFERDVC